MTEDLTSLPLDKEARARITETARNVLADGPSNVHAEIASHFLSYEATVVKLETELAARRALPSGGDTDGVSLIVAERQRQLTEKHWTAEHDDGHQSGELAKVAAVVALHHTDATVSDPGDFSLVDPWYIVGKHGHDPIRCLAIAGALIAAEIDRLSRAALSAPTREPRNG